MASPHNTKEIRYVFTIAYNGARIVNTYRISVLGVNSCDQAVCFDHYDVDAMLPSIAIRRAMKVANCRNEVSVVCRLYAGDITLTGEKKVRPVLGQTA